MKKINQSRREFLRAAQRLSVAGAAAPFALNLATIGAAAAQSATDYRALVCLFMHGGNDHNNTIIPYDKPSFDAYTAARPSIARNMADLVPLTSATPLRGNNAGRQFALPTELASLKPVWDAGKLGVLANVGPLIVPTAKAQYLNRTVPLPPKLFSHNDQQSIWQTFAPEGANAGWGGRIGDLLASQNADSTFVCSSVGGNSVFVAGRTVRQYQIDVEFGLPLFRMMREDLQGDTGVFGTDPGAFKSVWTPNIDNPIMRDLADIPGYAYEADLKFRLGTLSNMNDFPLPASLSGSKLGAQLRVVARMIAAREKLGARRQVFFVSLGAFDTHDNQHGVLHGLHYQVGNALSYFYNATVAMGVADQVTTFTASDFGRTLTSNGDGTDHGWGSHHFVMGGAVKGREYYGTFPAMGLNNNDEVGSGRLLPTTSVDQFAATLARWMGVSESDLRLVTPNIGNFDNTNLGFLNI